MADDAILIRQPHGGALFPPRPSDGRSGWRKTKHEAHQALRAMTPEAMERLRSLMQSDDERVAMVASKEILDRVLGKPTDAPQMVDEEGNAIDLNHLSPEGRTKLAEALATIRLLTGKGPSIAG